MQKFTIFTPFKYEKSKKRAKYHIGQRVFIIQWKDEKPFILDTHIHYIGLDNFYDANSEITYIVDRGIIREDDLKIFSEKDIYKSHLDAVKEIKKHLMKIIKSYNIAINNPAYSYFMEN